jgi:hypothetical protein
MPKTKERHNLHTVHQAVETRTDFECNGTLRGGAAQGGLGRLPQRHVSDYLAAYSTPDFYAVYSYATPIAWFANGAWFVPNVKYSQTTSRHLSSLHLPTNWANTAKDDPYVMLGF